MLPLSRRLLASSEHHDLPPLLIPPAVSHYEPGVPNNLQSEPGKWLPAEPEERYGRWTKSEEKAYTLLVLPQSWNICAFPLLCGCCANVSDWCLECEPIVIFGLFMRRSEPQALLVIDILCMSMAAEADIIILSMLQGTDAGILCRTRINWPFDLFCEIFSLFWDVYWC